MAGDGVVDECLGRGPLLVGEPGSCSEMIGPS
jgi:hypothetical protein